MLVSSLGVHFSTTAKSGRNPRNLQCCHQMFFSRTTKTGQNRRKTVAIKCRFYDRENRTRPKKHTDIVTLCSWKQYDIEKVQFAVMKSSFQHPRKQDKGEQTHDVFRAETAGPAWSSNSVPGKISVRFVVLTRVAVRWWRTFVDVGNQVAVWPARLGQNWEYRVVVQGVDVRDVAAVVDGGAVVEALAAT